MATSKDDFDQLKNIKDVADRVRKPPSKAKPKVPELSIFEKVRNDPKFTTARSHDWFRAKIKELSNNAPSFQMKTDLLKTTKPIQTTRFLPGSLFIFKYDPKWKEELPYYDTWPCSLIFGMEGDRVFGINIHYLNINLRCKLFDKIWMIAQVYRNNQQQCKRLTWRLLGNVAKFPEVAGCTKSYLYSHIQSKLIKVDIDDWKTSIHLPVASFAKKSQDYVIRETSKIVRKAMHRTNRVRL